MKSESADENQPEEKRRKGTAAGAATALGVGVGVALYSATDIPDWIAVGVGLAIGVGVAMGLDPRNDPRIATRLDTAHIQVARGSTSTTAFQAHIGSGQATTKPPALLNHAQRHMRT